MLRKLFQFICLDPRSENSKYVYGAQEYISRLSSKGHRQEFKSVGAILFLFDYSRECESK